MDMLTKRGWIPSLGALVVGLSAFALEPDDVIAADHIDAPLTQGDASVDIADLYAWPTARGTIVVALTFHPGLEPGADPVFDDTALYTIHIDNTATIVENNDVFDNDNDNTSDIQIHVRFGQNGAGEWGVQFTGLPGADDEPLVGPVQTELSRGTATAIAGIYDDPFFFDFDAFVATVGNLLDDADPVDLAFTPGAPVDTFAGTNTMAIVVEFDAALAAGDNPDNFLQIWATTGAE